jgi:hypothetical protein
MGLTLADRSLPDSWHEASHELQRNARMVRKRSLLFPHRSKKENRAVRWYFLELEPGEVAKWHRPANLVLTQQ